MPVSLDLDALAHNIALVGERAPGCAVMVAVKANAYGHGAVTISRELERLGTVTALGVAHVAEGMQLRGAGIELPILKLSHCSPDEVDAAVAGDLWLTVVDEATIAEAEAAAGQVDRQVGVHLKLDTGMGRIGAPPADAVRLARLVDQAPHLDLIGVFTHLPIADQPSSDDWTNTQLDTFCQAVDQIVRARGPVRYVHAQNSAGVLRFPRPQFTMVRPGIMAYGYSPDPVTMPVPELRPVLSWTSELTFVKHVSAGTTIGYGRTWTAPRDTWIGTVAVGYGDGFSRLNGNRGSLLIGGRSVPVVGRVCMDQTMVDLGTDPGTIRPGDEVVVIGRSDDLTRTADDLAEEMGTISYEVLCLIGSRVKRLH